VLEYIINDNKYSFSDEGSSGFTFGDNIILSREDTDITYEQSWYGNGYEVLPLFSIKEHSDLLKGISNSVNKLISSELKRDCKDFNLQDYHSFITSNEDHFKIVSKTRGLLPEDFNFNIMEMISRFNDLFGFEFSNLDKKTGYQSKIIVRINRPFSTDFNPPHKDSYEVVDQDGSIPQFVNFWIPVCGVTENSSLPIVEKSHLLPESKVERTPDGGVIEGNKYRVRTVKSWDGSNKLQRVNIQDGQLLVFSPHLIHGLAVNEEKNQTRVALEFRLYKK